MKTAVEWLVQELHDNGYFHEGVPEDIVKKAKEMEKEKIMDAHEEGFYSPPFRMSRRKEAEQYYNKTFKSE
jgi:HEPN domain-containing protein